MSGAPDSPKRYDASVKIITEANPTAVARFATRSRVDVVDVLDREMPITELRVDALMRVRERGLEYQRSGGRILLGA